MARTKARLGDGARLTDYLSACLLARVYPPAQVERALQEHGCGSQRVRSFPAVAVVYYAMALSLYPEAAYEEVFAAVAQGLAWRARSATSAAVAKSSISAARAKVTWPVLRQLQQACCVPLARGSEHPEAFYLGLRLMAIDGSCFELPDEAENVAQFGYPGSNKGHAGYPQARCVALVECGTHAIVGATLGAYRDSEWSLAAPLIDGLGAEMLCLADRGFAGYEHWQRAVQSKAQLLWRMPRSLLLPVEQALTDGSYRSALYRNEADRKARRDGLAVRVIEYTLPGAPQAESFYRLVTTLMDERQAPGEELARLYHERWEVESVFDELKIHLGASRRTLRSKTPALVRQEFYGWTLTHYAVRWLMHAAAREHHVPPRSLSFTANLHVLRRSQPQSGAIPPSAPEKVVD